MSKTKGVPSHQLEPEQSRTLDSAHCLVFPQELLDKVINLSIHINPLLGPLPQEVNDPFQCPFLHVNQACRRRVFSIISSLTWIELKSNGPDHLDLVCELAKCFAVVHPVWAGHFLQHANTSRIIVEFDREVAPSVVMQGDNDTKSHFIPYSYAAMLRMLMQIDDIHHDFTIDSIALRSERLSDAHLREVQLFLSLRLARDISPLNAELDYSLEAIQVNPTGMKEPLSLIISRIGFVNKKLREESALDFRSQYMLLVLHISKVLAHYVHAWIPAPYFTCWPATLATTDWLTGSIEAKKYLQIIWSFHRLETTAFRSFSELLTTDNGWTVWQAPYLTNNFARWTKQPRLSYYGLPNDDMVNFLHDAGTAIGLYFDIEGWPVPRPHTSFSGSWNFSPLYRKLRDRVSLFQCASRLRPEDRALQQEHTQAKEDLSRIFPNVVDSWDDHVDISYVDVDGEQRIYYRTPVTNWHKNDLIFLHRAQQVIEIMQDQVN